jgi:hypothetical protein
MFAVVKEEVYYLITDDFELAEAYAFDMFQRQEPGNVPIELIDYESKKLIYSLAESASFN